jgi:hypothetical protein
MKIQNVITVVYVQQNTLLFIDSRCNKHRVLPTCDNLLFNSCLFWLLAVLCCQ